MPQWYNSTKGKKKIPWRTVSRGYSIFPQISVSQVTAEVDLGLQSPRKNIIFYKTRLTWNSFRTSGKSEASQCPNIMCTLIITMLNLFVIISSPIFIGIQRVTAVSHQQRSTLTWQPAELEVDPVLCLDSAISLSKPSKPPTPMWSLPSPFRMWELQTSNIFFLQRNKTIGKEYLFAVLVFLKHLIKNPFQNDLKTTQRGSQIEQNLKPATVSFPLWEYHKADLSWSLQDQLPSQLGHLLIRLQRTLFSFCFLTTVIQSPKFPSTVKPTEVFQGSNNCRSYWTCTEILSLHLFFPSLLFYAFSR